MQGDIYRDAEGKIFTVQFVDHNMEGSWVHYTEVDTGKEYSCLIDAFKERFKKVVKGFLKLVKWLFVRC